MTKVELILIVNSIFACAFGYALGLVQGTRKKRPARAAKKVPLKEVAEPKKEVAKKDPSKGGWSKPVFKKTGVWNPNTDETRKLEGKVERVVY